MREADLPGTDPEELRRSGVTPEMYRDLYESGPRWEIGRPQREIVRFADAGGFAGDVLDSGCGTGENALYLASRGCNVLGVDLVDSAIEQAIVKNAERGLSARFKVHDGLNLAGLGERFDTILDSGVFHTFSDTDRPLYVRSLGDVLKPGGRLVLLCFSDAELREGGPRRVSQDEIRAAFADGWSVESIAPARYEVTVFADGACAWLAQLRKE